MHGYQNYEPFKLDDDFLSQYAETTPPWGYGDLSWVTYKRTYARKKKQSYLFPDRPEETDEREDWWETCRRVIEGVKTIQKIHCGQRGLPWDEEKARRHARDMYDRLFNFKWTPPGRGLWQMGTDFIFERTGAPLQNCGFYSTKDIDKDFAEPFCWAFEMSMLGVGVGFDTRGSGKVRIQEPEIGGDVHVIGDSREGWRDALRRLLNAFVGEASLPSEWDYSEIRPKGAPIESFGGVASGPDPLEEMIETLEDLYRERIGQPVDAEVIVDTMNIAGKCVVSGGVRRTAQVALGDANNEQYLDLKQDPEKVQDYRWASNNSVFAEVGMDYSDVAERTAENGEPGYFWMGNAQKYGRMKDPPDHQEDGIGLNPCCEMVLQSGECCTLVESYPAHHDDVGDLLETLKAAYQYGKTVTLVNTHYEKTNQVMQKNRRIGCSMTGIVQAINKHGYRNFIQMCDEGYEYIQHLDKQYSDWLGVPRSVRTTTVKPSGCRPWYALTTTTGGILTLEEMFGDHKDGDEWSKYPDDTEVVQDESTSRITKTYDNGESELYRIELSYGLRLESTPNHRWFVESSYRRDRKERHKDHHEWKRADELEEGDIIELNLGVYDESSHVEMSKITNRAISMRKDVKEINQPDYMNEDLAWFLGYLWGNGAMSPRKYRLRFSSNHDYTLEKLSKIIEEQFGVDTTIRGTSGDRDCRCLEFGSKYLWHWLIRNDVWKYYDDGLDVIPKKVRESSRDDILAFIAGLIDSDGCVESDRARFTYSTSCDFFAQHLQDVCWAVGIGVGCSHNTRGDNFQDRKDVYLMTSCVHQDPDAWDVLCEHSLKMSREMDRDDFGGWQWENSSHGHLKGKVKSVEKVGVRETFDIEVEDDHWYYAGAAKSHNTVSTLSGSTPGVHWGHSPYYIRRVRVQDTSELVDRCRKAGYPVEKDTYADNTYVIEFPVKAENMERGKSEVSLREKVSLAARLQHEWSDNGVSCTAEFDPETEADEIPRLLEEYEDQLKAVSFLPEEDHGYEQMPYEEISKEEYERRISAIDPISGTVDVDHDREDKFCSGEACKIDPD